MKKEKPIRVIKGGKAKHKTEQRVFAREIHESFCVQPGCKFEGEHAVQNVCHTQSTFTGSDDWSYIDSALQAGEEHVANLRKHAKTDKEHIRLLESEVAVAWANAVSTLDQLIRLRGRVAVLQKSADQKKAAARRARKRA